MPSSSKGSFPINRKRGEISSKQLEEAKETLVFYESPHRISETLKDILEILGDREMVLARELTKTYEEVFRGRVSEIQKQIGEPEAERRNHSRPFRQDEKIGKDNCRNGSHLKLGEDE